MTLFLLSSTVGFLWTPAMTFNSHCFCLLILFCELHPVHLWTTLLSLPQQVSTLVYSNLNKLSLLDLVRVLSLVFSSRTFWEYPLLLCLASTRPLIFWEHALVLSFPISVGFWVLPLLPLSSKISQTLLHQEHKCLVYNSTSFSKL